MGFDFLPDGSIVERLSESIPQGVQHTQPGSTMDPAWQNAHAAALAAFRNADSDHNGVLSFDEFERAFRNQFKTDTAARKPHVPALNLSKVSMGASSMMHRHASGESATSAAASSRHGAVPSSSPPSQESVLQVPPIQHALSAASVIECRYDDDTDWSCVVAAVGIGSRRAAQIVPQCL